MKRYKHSLSHYNLLTADMGKLYPVACFDVLPGDTVQQATSALIRVSPLLAPVMHPVTVRIHHWFVPFRLIWSEWEDFITGGPLGTSTPAVPTITAGGGGFSAKSLVDYMGVPPSVASLPVSALPVRAYNLIFNEFYRDQDLVTELVVPTASGADATSPNTVQAVAWEKDYFTSARPWTQKGSAVTLPLGTSATVKTNASELLSGAATTMIINKSSDGATPGAAKNLSVGSTGGVQWDDAAPGANPQGWYPSNLYADLSTATAVDVNTVRRAFALQRYEEARAIYGSRYTEYLRYLGVRSSDARLQRPEYLGGGKQTIAFTEVLQTGTNFDANTGVATLRGHGISAMRSRRYRRFFEEHGIVLSLMSVRPKTMYANQLPRFWSKSSKEDFWQKELELIGQQPVYVREVYAENAANIFGYQDRYAEYRYKQSGVCGEFRDTSLNFWHLARIFGAAPTLNSSFVTCDPSKRIHAVQSADVLWIMANNSIQARRMVRRDAGIGRII